jgi:hypothetical protein
MPRMQLGIKELEVIATKAQADYDMIPDDGSQFPNLSDLKALKISVLNVMQTTKGLAENLSKIREEQDKPVPI